MLMILFMAAAIGCASIVSGCTLVRPNDNNDGDTEENGGSDIDDLIMLDGDGEGYEYVTVDIPAEIDEQIGLINTLKDEWMPEVYAAYSTDFAVTDLDYDGYLEVVVMNWRHSRWLEVSYSVYEVAVGTNDLIEWSIDFDEEGSMPGFGLEDFVQCAVIYGADGDKAYAYTVSDYSEDNPSCETEGNYRQYAMYVEDNVLKFEKLGYGIDDISNGGDSTRYFDADGNVISYMDYEQLSVEYYFSILSDFDLKLQGLGFELLGDVTVDALTESYEKFRLYTDAQEYYDVNGGLIYNYAADDYPEGWIPDGYSYEERYSALGEFVLGSIDKNYLVNNSWNAFEVHDENLIYLYDYRDGYDRLNTCYVEFYEDGTGIYSDGYGNSQALNYDIYTVYEFGINNAQFELEDGTIGYIYAYTVYDNNINELLDCVVVNFLSEEIYFSASLG